MSKIITSIGKYLLRDSREGVKKVKKIVEKDVQNERIDKALEKASPFAKGVGQAKDKKIINTSDIKKLTKDKKTRKVLKKLIKREEQGRKPRGYISNKIKKEVDKLKDKPDGMKNGKFVQVKTKLGRNRPTKLY